MAVAVCTVEEFSWPSHQFAFSRARERSSVDFNLSSFYRTKTVLFSLLAIDNPTHSSKNKRIGVF